MSSVVLFVLASIGLMSIVTTSDIMEPLRNWVHNAFPEKYANGIECSQCVGFWSGVVTSILLDETTFYVGIQFIIMAMFFALTYHFYKNKHIHKYLIILFYSLFLLIVNPKESIHLILYGCAGSAVSILFVNIISWLDNNNYVDMPE